MKRSNLVWIVIAVLVVALLGTGIFIIYRSLFFLAKVNHYRISIKNRQII